MRRVVLIRRLHGRLCLAAIDNFPLAQALPCIVCVPETLFTVLVLHKRSLFSIVR
jgi:hypothetical protein